MKVIRIQQKYYNNFYKGIFHWVFASFLILSILIIIAEELRKTPEIKAL